MKMRAPYEFRQAIQVLAGFDQDSASALAKKIDTQAPKEIITDHEVHNFVKAAAAGSKRYTAPERAAAPAIEFLRKALAMKPAKTVRADVEDMSKLKVPQRVELAKIRGDISLGSRQVIRGTSIGDILDTDNPSGHLHAFAKSIAKNPRYLTLAELLRAQRDDKRGYDSYQQCNAILERYFVGGSVDEGDKKQHLYTSAHMHVSANVERSYDTYDHHLDVNLRPNVEVKGRPGDFVIIHSSLRHSEPEVAQLTKDRPSFRFPWWGDSNVPSTMTILVARPGMDGAPPEVVDSVKLEIPVNVAHVKAEAPHAGRTARV